MAKPTKPSPKKPAAKSPAKSGAGRAAKSVTEAKNVAPDSAKPDSLEANNVPKAAAAKPKPAPARKAAATSELDKDTPVALKAPGEKSDAAKEAEAPVRPAAMPKPASAPKSGGARVAPFVLVGIVAIGLGFAAARFLAPVADIAPVAALNGQIADQESRIAGLEAELAAALAVVELDVAEQARLREQLSSANAIVAELTAEVAALEARPQIADGTVPSAELSAVLEDLAAQRREKDALAVELKAMTDAAQAKLAEAEARAVIVEATALARSKVVATRAALTELRVALESGGSYAAALAEFDQAAVPAALTGPATDGVATLTKLQHDFPVAARAALTASLRAEAGDRTLSRLAAFVQSQMGARSLAPRDGDDPDAVLSRAEAALAEGRLNAALAELGGLPAEGHAAMSGWITRAEARAEALAAYETLATGLNGN